MTVHLICLTKVDGGEPCEAYKLLSNILLNTLLAYYIDTLTFLKVFTQSQVD